MPVGWEQRQVRFPLPPEVVMHVWLHEMFEQGAPWLHPVGGAPPVPPADVPAAPAVPVVPPPPEAPPVPLVPPAPAAEPPLPPPPSLPPPEELHAAMVRKAANAKS